MKVLAVLGSPKKNGNSAVLVEKFLAKASSLGAETSSYFLEGMKYKGCKACGKCKTESEKCVIKDDLTPLLDEMHHADVIVYATPNYFSDVTGQFKLFLDRTFSLLTPEFRTGPKTSRLSDGKRMVFILTQAAPDKAFADIPGKYEQISKYFCFSEFNLVRGCDLFESGDAAKRADLISQTEKLAERLLAN